MPNSSVSNPLFTTKPSAPALAVLSGLSLALIAFSQTGGIYDGDEGLHLVAALAVKSGRQPYVDFFYWHQPLYLYLASAWMSVFGESWRSVHVLSAMLTAAAAVLVGTFTPGFVKAPQWRTRFGVVAASLFALNVLVLKWGTIGHNYALCLVLSVAAFRLVIVAAQRPDLSLVFCGGLLAGGAMATSLLMALLGPILLIWFMLNNEAGNWKAKSACFVGAATIPFLPLMWLSLAAPYATFFDLIAHHLFYRVPVDDASEVHWEVLFSWLRSPQALLLVLLSALGLWSVGKGAGYDARARSHAYLCAAIVVAVGTFVAISHPPARTPYFVLVTPFLAILAALGTHASAQRLRTARAGSVTLAVLGFFVLAALGSLYRERSWVSEWSRVEAFAEAVNQVTPAHASFYTSYTFVYFAARHLPPPGLENGWASLMPIPPDLFATLSVIPAAEVAESVRSGGFYSTLLWRDDSRFNTATLEQAYTEARELDRYFVLRWNPASGDPSVR